MNIQPLHLPDLLQDKKMARAHSSDEIRGLVEGFTEATVPDYQMAAWLMAVYFQGLDDLELSALTDSLMNSGRRYSWDGMDRPIVDKHSSGGVGDKTSLVLIPLVAACGLAIPKISGRGLGLTGGTVDKLESIPGMKLNLDAETFKAQVESVGAAIVGQSADFVPADGGIYALRELTSTTDSIPLIAASIMSKKLATGADTILLDVKVGSGAFMRDLAEARLLAKTMVSLGTRAGRKTRAFVSSMDNPLGHAIGNSLEVAEAIETLRGDGPSDLVELAITFAAALIRDSGLRSAPRAARELAERMLSGGYAYEKLEELVEAQGGNLEAFVQSPAHDKLGSPIVACAPLSGYISGIDARCVALLVRSLGGGRMQKSDSISPGVGIRLLKKIGDSVQAGEVVAEIYAQPSASEVMVSSAFLEAVEIGESRPLPIATVLSNDVGDN